MDKKGNYTLRLLARRERGSVNVKIGFYEVWNGWRFAKTVAISHSANPYVIKETEEDRKKKKHALSRPILWYGDNFPREFKPDGLDITLDID